jgi:hypothetical protein
VSVPGFRLRVVIIRHFRHTVHMPGAREKDARASVKRMGAAALAIVALTIGVLTAPAAAAAPASAQPAVHTAGANVAAGIVKAADLSKFQPGNIIGDAVFFNRSAMTEAQIQSFCRPRSPRADRATPA